MGARGDTPRRRGESALHAWAAKTSRPRVPLALVRERLFAQLRAASDRPVVWVSAPAGAGKTTLASSYTSARRRPVLWYTFDEGDAELATFFHHLGSVAERVSPLRRSPPLPRLTPEYAHGVPVFSRRFFERLFERLERRSILVFDNFQELPTSTALQRLLANAVDAFPRGTQLLVLSRGAPPAAWARPLSHGAIALLTWKDLRLTPVEARRMLRLLCRSRRRELHAGQVEELVRCADGWAAGLVLMLEAIGEAPEIRVGSASRALLFDYFASEIFDSASPEAQEWLLRTALLPSVTGAALAVLCRDERPERILAALTARNYLMVKLESDPDTYRYHPLFRDFLLQRARETWNPRTLRTRRRVAAAALLSSGQVWAAVELLLLCKDWNGAARSILPLLPGLVSQGRFQVAMRWLSALPNGLMAKTPWLLYWRGVCGLASDPSGARQDFESAYRAFERLGDTAGMYLTLAEAIGSTWGGSFDFVQMDRWLDRFDRVAAEHPQLPAEIEAQVLPSLLMGLYFRRLGHPRIPHWLARAQALLRTSLPPPQRGAILCSLGWHLYGSRAFRGWILQLASLEDRSGDGPPLLRLSQLVSIGYGSLYAGECARARAAARDGLALAEETGVHTFDLMLLGVEVEAALLVQELATADAALEKLGRLLAAAPNDFFGSFEAYLRSWRALLGGDVGAAVELGRRAVALSEGCGALYPIASCRYALSHALLEADRTQEGLESLERSRLRWPGAEHEHQAFLCELTEAWVRCRRGERDRAEALLWRALERGETMGYGPPLLARPSFLQPLFRLALEQDRHATYVGRLIGEAKLASPSAAVMEWPTPVRVRTLGGLAVTVDGSALRPDLPRQKRPLELLQALIASGGREVHKERLCDALWPDASGDKATISLNTTLHRLRKLLSRDDAIKLKNGRLSLDPRLVWVDVWGLQALLEEIESVLASVPSDAPRLDELQRRLAAVYRGRFLHGEPEHAWSLSLAERIQQRVLRAALALTQHWRRRADTSRAIATSEWALQLDPACEELCRQMMRLHAERGERAAAVSIFQRFRQALSLQADTQPSPQTLALFESVRSGGPSASR